MKTKFILVILLIAGNLQAQNVENPSFDSVYIGGIDRIHQWITSDSWYVLGGDTVQPFAPDSDYVSVGLQFHELLHSVQLEYSGAFDGPYAIQLFSDTVRVDIFGNSFPGFIVNGDHFFTDSTGYIDLAKCGTPFTDRPDKLRGHYKYEDHSPSLSNYPRAYLLLKKYNPATQHSDTVGYGMLSMQLFPVTNWQLFEMPVTYLSSQTPDSIVLAFFAPRLRYQSTFKIDSLGFEYSSVNIEESGTKSIQYYIKDKSLFIENPNDLSSISVFDYAGRKILKREGASEVNLSELKTGIYICVLELKNGMRNNFRFSIKE